jgi:hypothetical protein
MREGGFKETRANISLENDGLNHRWIPTHHPERGGEIKSWTLRKDSQFEYRNRFGLRKPGDLNHRDLVLLVQLIWRMVFFSLKWFMVTGIMLAKPNTKWHDAEPICCFETRKQVSVQKAKWR